MGPLRSATADFSGVVICTTRSPIGALLGGAEAQAALESIETAKRAKRAEEAAVEEAAAAKATAEAAEVAASGRALRTHDGASGPRRRFVPTTCRCKRRRATRQSSAPTRRGEARRLVTWTMERHSLLWTWATHSRCRSPKRLSMGASETLYGWRLGSDAAIPNSL